MKAKGIILKGMRIYAEDLIIDNGYLHINNRKIIGFGSLHELKNEQNAEVITLPGSFQAVPGFIDIHIHGVNGADTMDSTKEALEIMAASLPKEGTTSFLATTITQEIENIERAIKNAGDYIKGQSPVGMAEIIGIHLEGPFVNVKKAGAQPHAHIIDPNLSLLKKWQKLADNNIKVVTLAPEQPGGIEMIKYLSEQGIVASLGHTDASYEQVMEAVSAGSRQVTHLFNQMRGLHHREPGTVGAALLHDELKAEIIADGVHVHPEMINLAYKQKQSNGLILITDAMRAKCLKNGKYDLGGQEVTVAEGKAVLQDGTLAGSILKMEKAFQNITLFTGCSIEEAVQMTSINPAKQLGIYDRKGSIQAGKDADIVILDEQLNVYMTFCRGDLAYQRRETPNEAN